MGIQNLQSTLFYTAEFLYYVAVVAFVFKEFYQWAFRSQEPKSAMGILGNIMGQMSHKPKTTQQVVETKTSVVEIPAENTNNEGEFEDVNMTEAELEEALGD